MKSFFKPEDFSTSISDKKVAETANAKLEKLIESWDVVYGYHDDDGIEKFTFKKNIGDTHSAKLAFIEPLLREDKKEEVFVDAGISVNGEALFKKVIK